MTTTAPRPSPPSPQSPPALPSSPRSRIHPAWWVAAVAFVAIVGAAGFRATPGVLIDPLHAEFGWSRTEISAAVSVNLLLYGLTAPFAAALMERFGMRLVVSCALLLVAAGSGLTVFMTAPWQLVACWGVLVGLGTGSMALAFVATVTGRWFVRQRGLVTGILTAGGAAGQLVFLPILARLTAEHGWRSAALTVAGTALLTAPFVGWLLRDYPHEVGVTAYGALPDPAGAGTGGAGGAGGAAGAGGAGAGTGGGSPATVRVVAGVGAARRALGALRDASRTGTFWLLAAGFAICGASTNGLIGTHFIPAAHDHGMPATTAAGLLALIGIFDIAGTIGSGWLTDRMDSRLLLAGYYLLRGCSLMLLPWLLAASVRPSTLVFIIVYGLDWVATVPPTIALCRERYGERAAVVFGWVFASHQVGAAFAAVASGVLRDQAGSYTLAWYAAGLACLIAAVLSAWIPRAQPTVRPREMSMPATRSQ